LLYQINYSIETIAMATANEIWFKIMQDENQ